MGEQSEPAARVEATVEACLHRARRMVLEVFGAEAGHEHGPMKVQIASAMVTLEAAEIVAASLSDRKEA